MRSRERKCRFGKVSPLERSQVFTSDDPEEREKPVGPQLEELAAMLAIWVRGHLRDIVGLAPDHCNQVSTAVKQVVILSLVEDLAHSLYKMQFLQSAAE